MNPYFYPYQANNIGLFQRIFPNGFSLSSLINGTSKTLNMINQAIPIIKQVGPTVKNAKTMFKVMNEFKKVDTPKQSNYVQKEVSNQNIKKTNENIEIQKKEVISTSTPTFFL